MASDLEAPLGQPLEVVPSQKSFLVDPVEDNVENPRQLVLLKQVGDLQVQLVAIVKAKNDHMFFRLCLLTYSNYLYGAGKL